ncbi:hypothetical protein [Rhodococcus koreensis]|nr:hypothetical protein [Rhodococcus koreensis]SEB30125.1 hypothetical protein SAMN04490239_0196 [Rhodococcus koreensis]
MPKDLNRWLGRYMYREEAFRHAVLGTLTATGLTAAALTREVQNWGTEGSGVHPWASPRDPNSLATPNAPAVTVHSPKGAKP